MQKDEPFRRTASGCLAIVAVLFMGLFLLSTPQVPHSSPASRVLAQFVSFIREYRSTHNGTLPKDWAELFSGVPPQMVENARRVCDPEHRYQFMDREHPVVIPHVGQLWIMANRPGDEGGEGKDPGRMIFVVQPDGDVLRTCRPEAALQRDFAAAGLDLAAWTSPSPPLPGMPWLPGFTSTQIGGGCLIILTVLMTIRWHMR